MRLHLGGHLAWYEPQKKAWLDIHVPGPTLLIELLQQRGIPPGEVAITVVNGTAVPLEVAQVSDGDQVELFPPVGGGGLG